MFSFHFLIFNSGVYSSICSGITSVLFQVDEAVAVLQAHQAKEAAQKSTTPAGVPSV